MYEVGQIINIGYYGGFHCKKLIKTQAEIINITEDWIDIKVHLSSGGYRKMFGLASDLRILEENYNLKK